MRERQRRPVVIERLKRRSDFRAAANGRRAAGRSFVLQARRRAEDGSIRVGFTVSRQVGNAVERNRVRRRLREIVRLSTVAETDRLRPGHDYVLIGRRAALAAPFGEMVQELDSALSRLHARGGKGSEKGTGSGHRDRLHEAGSPSGPQQARRNRRRPSTSSEPPPRERE